MIMTNIFVVTPEGIYWNICHSNHHHLQILGQTAKYFRFDMFSGQHGSNKIITAKELMELIEKCMNTDSFELIKSLSKVKSAMGYVDHFILYDMTDEAYPEIHINLGSSERDTDDLVWGQLKLMVKKLREKK